MTNLGFIKVSIFPLDIQAGIRVDYNTKTEYGAYVIAAVEVFWRLLDIDRYRLHTKNQLIILDDLKLSKISVHKITQFGLRPPELRQPFNKLRDYYRWFKISSKAKIGDFHNKNKSNLSESCWFYGLKR